MSFIPAKSLSEDYATIGVSTQFTAAVDQLTGFLTALQTAPRILAVDQLRITAANAPATPQSPGKKQVNVYIVISGVARAAK